MTHPPTPAASPSPAPIELLAPAGDWDCVRAAIENGADAIYFGLDCGFNARHRAQNFGTDDLPALTRLLRQRGVKGYVTLNTLVFPSELEKVVEAIRRIAESGIDAVLVQDFGVARIVREVCPELEIHASTQMSLTSAETISVAKELGLARVVLARELSLKEIGKISAATDMPLEVFIHGALCVAYSGQCLTSESLGGRSANRGQCAQACRLPYELICDGEDRDLGDVRYLLSPQDLAGYDAIPGLIDAGVASIKIEGRLKTPEYVANITQKYRRAIDQAVGTGQVAINGQQRREMELSFSRGFSPGWLDGNDHKRLVPGLHSAKRGIRLGSVLETRKDQLLVEVAAPIALGDGLAIHVGDGVEVQGGRVYHLADVRGNSHQQVDAGTKVWIGFGRGEIDWQSVSLDADVFKNDDPQLNRQLRHSFSRDDPQRRQPIDIHAVAITGQRLKVRGRIGDRSIEVVADTELQVANKRPITLDVMREKLGRLGGTPFRLGQFEADVRGGPMVPMAMLNGLRRELVEAWLTDLQSPPPRQINAEGGRRLLEPIATASPADASEPAEPRLTVLCRTPEQLRAIAAIAPDVDLVYADFHDVREYRDAVAIANDHGLKIGLASVRMQKPGEMGLLKAIGKHRPDVLLARNLAALGFASDNELECVADFSLNVSNHRSAEWLRSLGASRFTGAYDLNRDQLSDLARAIPAGWMEVVIHQHMPMFHMEHCVFCSVLSPGTNKTNCGRPCDDHVVHLRDRVGAEHKLEADVACRNTLYNATPQSGAETVNELRRLGVRWFRLELLDQDERRTAEAVKIYRRLLAGQVSGQEVWRTLQATNRLGVTRGTLESSRNPLAIL